MPAARRAAVVAEGPKGERRPGTVGSREAALPVRCVAAPAAATADPVANDRRLRAAVRRWTIWPRAWFGSSSPLSSSSSPPALPLLPKRASVSLRMDSLRLDGVASSQSLALSWLHAGQESCVELRRCGVSASSLLRRTGRWVGNQFDPPAPYTTPYDGEVVASPLLTAVMAAAATDLSAAPSFDGVSVLSNEADGLSFLSAGEWTEATAGVLG